MEIEFLRNTSKIKSVDTRLLTPARTLHLCCIQEVVLNTPDCITLAFFCYLCCIQVLKNNGGFLWKKLKGKELENVKLYI